LVQWFEVRQEDLKLQSINHGEATVVADSAFWTGLKPSEPERDDPWFVSDDLRRLRAWNRMMEVQGQVVIAVIDSGINFQDPALAAMRWHNPGEQGGNGLDDDGNGYVDDTSGWDFVNEGYAQLFDDTNAPDNDPTDLLGHGTAVAHVIRAVVGSELIDRIRLMPMRVAFGLNGSGTVNPAALAEAIYYAADNGAHIINISLGGAQRYEIVAAAIQYAQGKGVALVVAAGNSGGAPLFPASEPGVLSVGALDRNNAVLTSSARGAGVDIFASGVDMITSTNTAGMTFQPSGTSFAAPVVSATLALLQAIHLGAANSCHEQRLAVLNQLPPGGQLSDWIAFQLQRSEHARQPTNTPDAWQQAVQTCSAPAASLSSLVRNP
jgi:subtilisin family serine protease